MALAFELFPEFEFVVVALGVGQTGFSEALLGSENDRFSDVVEENLAGVLHEGGEGEGFATCASAVVKYDLTWFAIYSHCCQLRPLILNLKLALLKLSQIEQIDLILHIKRYPIRRVLTPPHIKILPLKLPVQILSRIPQRVRPYSQRRSLILHSANPERFFFSIRTHKQIPEFLRAAGLDVDGDGFVA